MKPLVVCMALVCCLSFSSLSAQNKKIQFGLASALGARSYVFVNESDYVYTLHGRLSYTGGATIRAAVAQNFFIKSGLYYSTKGYSFNVDFTKQLVICNECDPNDYKLKAIFRTSYLEIPLDFQFHIRADKKLSMYPLAGIVTSYRVGKKARLDAVGVADDNYYYSNFLLSAKAGWGFQYKLNGLAVQVEPQLQFSLNDLHKMGWDNPFYIGMEVGLLKL